MCIGCKTKCAAILDDRLVKLDADGFAQTNMGSGGSGNMPNETLVELASALILKIRQFASRKGTTLQPNGLFSGSNSDRHTFLNQMEMIERYVTPLLRETRCAPVTSPAFVIGDINGNLADLLSLEAALWKQYPVIGPNLIFLGNMVGSGKWSVECVTYLLCLKVIMPEKVTLLRGNHEVRELNYKNVLPNYLNECHAKFGNEEGERMWELTNRIFDSLPLCAVIDEKIYCAHGGIPQTIVNLRDVSALPKVIENPNTWTIAWEILGSYPLDQKSFVEMARFSGIDPSRREGYLPNTKPDTAFFVFNEEALDRFLSADSLSHVVRSHEVKKMDSFFILEQSAPQYFRVRIIAARITNAPYCLSIEM